MAEKRLTASERDGLVALCVANEILGRDAEHLKERAKLVPGAKRDIAMIQKKTEQLIGALMNTIPVAQLPTVMRSLKMSSFVVGIKGPGDGRRDDKNFGMWVSNEVLNAMLEGLHDHCLMCNADKVGRKQCKLRKALDVLPNDVEDLKDGDCPYYEFV